MKVVENWKPVVGYEGLYEVSDLGRVRSLVDCHGWKRELIMTPSVDKDGYLLVCLYKNRVKKSYHVHRLVALTFVEGYDLVNNQVNHINEDKSDNRAINLEWCDNKYNMNYGTRTERVAKALSIPVVQLTLDYKFVAKWPSATEAGRGGFKQQKVTLCCQHKPKRKSTGGYRWFYLSEYEELCYKVVTAQHPFRLALPYRA